MKRIEIKKVWDNHISLRSTIVQEAIQRGETIEVVLGDTKMLLSPRKLKTGRQLTNTVFRSMWGDELYHLVDFPWKPQVEELRLFYDL